MLTCNNDCMQNDLIYKHIGSTIRNRRKVLKLTQEGLASRLFISRASLASIETGRQNVLVHQLYAFAKILDLNVNDFLVSSQPTTLPDKLNDLPLPSGLSTQQKEQLARFIKNGTPIIGVNSLHHPNRQRFTIAHELGHLVMHREILENEVHVDKQFRILMRDGVAATGTDTIEIDANRFAAELLLPSFLLDELLIKEFDIDDEGPLEALAKKFKVSKQMLEYRIRAIK